MALTSVAMKCFERLVMAPINNILPDTLDPLQFAYHPNRSTDDNLNRTPHCPFSPGQKEHVKMLFIDYSSAFNTIVPTKLITKLRTLGLNTSLCNWILDFLTGHTQVVRVGHNTSATLILNTGTPQECVLSPLLYSLFTHDCVYKHNSNTIIKFAWCPHHQRTIMVQTYLDSCEEGTTRPFPLQETEKIWHGPTDPQNVLQLHH